MGAIERPTMSISFAREETDEKATLDLMPRIIRFKLERFSEMPESKVNMPQAPLRNASPHRRDNANFGYSFTPFTQPFSK